MKTLGYAFEETREWLPEYWKDGVFDEPAYCRDVRKAVKEKYGWASPTVEKLSAFSGKITGSKCARQYTEYVINVRVDR